MISRITIRPLFALLALVLCAPTVWACLNPIGQYYMSEGISLAGFSGLEIVRRLNDHQDRAYWQDVLKQLLEKKRERSNEYEATNHAVALAHLGRVKEAISILLEIEGKTPGRYATAANLGTVYELNGENEKALKWIKEGFKRDKDGHSGSEWLHVKILETKLMLMEEPSFLKDKTVLNIRFDSETDPLKLYTTDHLGGRRTLEEIESALVYQLHERLEFIKPPEPVVADLLADLSSTFAITRTPEDSRAVYELAIKYGTTRPIYLKPPAKLPAIVAPPDVSVEALPPHEGWSTRSIALLIASVSALLIGLVVTFRFFLRPN